MSDDRCVAFEGSYVTLGVVAGYCIKLLVVGSRGNAEGGNGSHARAFRITVGALVRFRYPERVSYLSLGRKL